MTDSFHSAQLVHCPDCALAVRISRVPGGFKAVCPRCHAGLHRQRRQANQVSLACALAALIFLAFTLPFSFLQFAASGQRNEISMLSGLQTLVSHDFMFLAFIQVLLVVVIPLLVLLCIVYLQLAVLFARHFPAANSVLRILQRLTPWGMAEVFLLGALVSLIKIADMADVSLGISFFAFMLFTLCFYASLSWLDMHTLRQQLTNLGHSLQGQKSPAGAFDYSQRQRAIQLTWAMLSTAIILYLPANLLPIMTTSALGDTEANTILGGVVRLWQHGSYPVAIIIFLASVVVPLMKLIVLTWLNWTVSAAHISRARQRTGLYRMVEFIGRWSMVDVFVVAILVSLIQLETIQVYPGPAVVAFCLVVIMTMLAAITFDVRLLWTRRADG